MIKSLAEKAKISVPTGLTPDEWIDRYNEILVGLVIKECCTLVIKRRDAAIDAGCLVDEAMSTAVWDIEEHFGVTDGEQEAG